MSADPILVVQLRRMGDLIMTFPLFLELRRKYPEHPLQVVALPQFYSSLQPFAPPCEFLRPEAMPGLAGKNYRLVVNLSSQREAAESAASLAAEERHGFLAGSGAIRVAGFWHLYRASLTGNNRHNLFHWSDLFRLDLGFPLGRISRERMGHAEKGRIALFVGASEISKRPDASFWISLARRLKGRGKKPVLLGGQAEADLGREIARRADVPNFCGKTDLATLAALLSTVELLVTPDTGPMHLADWLGTPVLNLSLGNVSPYETGPLSPGQWVAQAAMSCSGCWQCWRGRQYCRGAFDPGAILEAAVACADRLELPPAPGLRFLRGGRDKYGLRTLEGLCVQQNAAALLDEFWRWMFLSFSGYLPYAGTAAAHAALAERYPRLALTMAAHIDKMGALFTACQKKGDLLPENFWQASPWHMRLFAGFSQMALQNGDYSRRSWADALQHIAILREIFSQPI